MALTAMEGTGTAVCPQHRQYLQDWAKVLQTVVQLCNLCILLVVYLVTYAHVTLAYVVLMPEVRSVVTVHQGESVKPLNCVGGHATI